MIFVEILDVVISIIGMFNVRLNFIIVKGGIIFSDVGIKVLRVKKVIVMG